MALDLFLRVFQFRRERVWGSTRVALLFHWIVWNINSYRMWHHSSCLHLTHTWIRTSRPGYRVLTKWMIWPSCHWILLFLILRGSHIKSLKLLWSCSSKFNLLLPINVDLMLYSLRHSIVRQTRLAFVFSVAHLTQLIVQRVALLGNFFLPHTRFILHHVRKV